MNDDTEPKPDVRLCKSQYFEHSWKWFEYHAAQRTTMFNFFLIATGILATAFVTAYDKNFPELLYGVGVLGMVIALAFFWLDWRNSELVKLSEKSLRKLEKNAENFPGKIFTSPLTAPEFRFKSHSFIMKAVHVVVLVAFGLATGYFWMDHNESSANLPKIQVKLNVDGEVKTLQCGLSKSNSLALDCSDKGN